MIDVLNERVREDTQPWNHLSTYTCARRKQAGPQELQQQGGVWVGADEVNSEEKAPRQENAEKAKKSMQELNEVVCALTCVQTREKKRHENNKKMQRGWRMDVLMIEGMVEWRKKVRDRDAR